MQTQANEGFCGAAREHRGGRSRCLVVWLAVASAVLGCGGPAVAGRGAGRAPCAPAAATGSPLDVALTDVAALALLGCALWVWAATHRVVVEVLAPASRRDQAARRAGRRPRVVLAACGVALARRARPHRRTPPAPAGHRDRVPRPPVAAVRAPAPRAGAVAARPRPPAEPPPAATRASSGPATRCGRSPPATSRPAAPTRASPLGGMRSTRANRAVIGADPDLIRPGQRLRLPGPRTRMMLHQVDDDRRDATSTVVTAAARPRSRASRAPSRSTSQPRLDAADPGRRPARRLRAVDVVAGRPRPAPALRAARGAHRCRRGRDRRRRPAGHPAAALDDAARSTHDLARRAHLVARAGGHRPGVRRHPAGATAAGARRHTSFVSEPRASRPACTCATASARAPSPPASSWSATAGSLHARLEFALTRTDPVGTPAAVTAGVRAVSRDAGGQPGGAARGAVAPLVLLARAARAQRVAARPRRTRRRRW